MAMTPVNMAELQILYKTPVFVMHCRDGLWEIEVRFWYDARAHATFYWLGLERLGYLSGIISKNYIWKGLYTCHVKRERRFGHRSLCVQYSFVIVNMYTRSPNTSRARTFEV